jgi:hypothetical protein
VDLPPVPENVWRRGDFSQGWRLPVRLHSGAGEGFVCGMSDSRRDDLERQADAARKKLADTEHRAEEALEQAAEELRELKEEQEATEERLRRESRSPMGPASPGKPKEEKPDR